MIIEGMGLILTTSETDENLLVPSFNKVLIKKRISLVENVERASEADIACVKPPLPGLYA